VLQEVKVSPFIGLGDMIDEELGVTPVVAWWGWFPGGAALGQFLVADMQVQFTVSYIQFNEVTILD
jgi:hypothetical protein